MLMEGYWFSYALVIVILRGIIVVFTYIVRLTPNERFERYRLIILFIVIFFITIGWDYVINNSITYLCLTLWLWYVRFYNLFIVRFLLRIMLIVVWFRYINEGAVRLGY